MTRKGIPIEDLKPEAFIERQVEDIRRTAGEKGTAINALSGGLDSSVVAKIGHRALGDRLKTVFIDNGLMREGEPEGVAALFKELGIFVEIITAKDEFLKSLKGLVDPEAKREAVTQTFYRDVFGRIVREGGARFLIQGIGY